MPYQISFDANPKAEDIQILGNGILEFARQKKGHGPIEFFAFYIRDEENKIVGGCSGDMLYGCLWVGYLWVSEHLRGQGYGTKLMESVENFGKERGCLFSAVNTMDWEALAFYKKLGYRVEFERHGFLKNSIFYFLRKYF